MYPSKQIKKSTIEKRYSNLEIGLSDFHDTLLIDSTYLLDRTDWISKFFSCSLFRLCFQTEQEYGTETFDKLLEYGVITVSHTSEFREMDHQTNGCHQIRIIMLWYFHDLRALKRRSIIYDLRFSAVHW
jgi:hypothetical protein